MWRLILLMVPARQEAIFTDGERHGAECADRREDHKDVDHAEYYMSQRNSSRATIGLKRAAHAEDKLKAKQNLR